MSIEAPTPEEIAKQFMSDIGDGRSIPRIWLVDRIRAYGNSRHAEGYCEARDAAVERANMLAGNSDLDDFTIGHIAEAIRNLTPEGKP